MITFGNIILLIYVFITIYLCESPSIDVNCDLRCRTHCEVSSQCSRSRVTAKENINTLKYTQIFDNWGEGKVKRLFNGYEFIIIVIIIIRKTYNVSIGCDIAKQLGRRNVHALERDRFIFRLLFATVRYAYANNYAN